MALAMVCILEYFLVYVCVRVENQTVIHVQRLAAIKSFAYLLYCYHLITDGV